MSVQYRARRVAQHKHRGKRKPVQTQRSYQLFSAVVSLLSSSENNPPGSSITSESS